MSILIYSNRCKHCNDLLKFVQSNPTLGNMIKYHDVNKNGIPQQFTNKLTSVPTLVTTTGKVLTGLEVRQWLESLLPNTVEHMAFGNIGMGNLDGTLGSDDIFELDNYGQTLQPPMTPELEDKINKKVD
jgi:hypothetical protein